MSFVLKPLSKEHLINFFDETAVKVIHFFLKKSMISQPEKINGQPDLPVHIPKEHLEQWIVQALNVKPKGAGSYPVDVISKKWAADIKMLSCKVDMHGQLKNADSGETSLGQKFDDSHFGRNNTLDDLFKKKQYDVIWDSWKTILINKYKVVESDHNINTIFYFIILRAQNKFHLCGLNLDLKELNNVTVNLNRSTKDSVFLNNFINNELGSVKIYKAKKRLELRLRPKKWIEEGKVLTFDTNFKQPCISIRDLIKQGELDKYIEKNLIVNLKPKD